MTIKEINMNDEKEKHYIIYQITNKINGKIYIGKHITSNLNDGYMGSGKAIKIALNKYGVDNFEKTILFECSSEDELNKKEAEFVTKEFIARDDVYNIIPGGYGGWEAYNNIIENNLERRKQRKLNLSKRGMSSFRLSFKTLELNSNQLNSLLKKIDLFIIPLLY
jgi:hypothetical protein